MNFELLTTANGGKKIVIQAYRENRTTGQIRRHAGIKITQKRKQK